MIKTLKIYNLSLQEDTQKIISAQITPKLTE